MKSFEIEKKRLPSLLIGSSPFCGSGQFGDRAREYYRRFFEQPANIAGLLVEFVNRGYEGAHLLPLPPLVDAAQKAYEITGKQFPVILTLMPGDEEQQWKLSKKLNTAAMFLHAFEADKLDLPQLETFSKRCRDEGVAPGVSTHNGGVTIPAIDEAGIDIAAYLCPFNKTGAHVHPSLEEVLKAIQNTDKKVIGMKVLSCGLLHPEDAFEFALPYVDAITVGMVEKWEIVENCRIFDRLHHLLCSVKKRD